MLTLPLTRSGDVQIAHDHRISDRLYVSTTRINVARRGDNSTDLQLLTWMSADGSQNVEGGRLNASLSVFPDAASIQAAGLNLEIVQPMPWRNVTVVLRGPNLETTPSHVVIRNNGNALVSIDLDRQAALFLRGALNNPGLTPLSAVWSGVVDLHFPAISVQAYASRSEIESRLQQLSPEVKKDSLKSIISANINIQIDAGSDEDAERLIRDWCINEMTRRFSDESDLLIEASAADIVEWPITIQSTLSLDAADQSTVRSLVLSDNELGAEQQTLVRILADFEETIQRVDVEINAGSTSHRLAFTDTQSQKFTRPDSSFSWRWRANLGNDKSTLWSDWHIQDPVPSMLIPVSLPEDTTIEIVASRLDFIERWAQVIVKLSVGTGEPQFEQIVLDRHISSVTVTQTGALATGLNGHAQYIALNGQTVERPISLAPGKTLLALEDPLTDSALKVTLVPVGSGWRDVALAMVDLRLTDGEDTWLGTRALDTIDATAQWYAPIRRESARKYEWRVHTSYQDGRFETSAWKQDSSSLLSVRLDAPRRREIQIVAVYLRPDEKVVVRLEMDAKQWSTTLVDATPSKLELPPGEFKWFAQWQLGQEHVREETSTTSANVIVLPRSPEPEN